MNKEDQPAGAPGRLLLALVAFTAIALILGPGGPSSSPDPSSAATTLPEADKQVQPAAATVSSEILVEFRVASPNPGEPSGTDSWTTRLDSIHSAAGTVPTVEGRAFLVDPSGKRITLPKWTSTDPSVVSIEPSPGDIVILKVKRPGNSSLQVSSEGASRILSLKATNEFGVLRVQIAGK